MRIAFVGAGALGRVYGVRLATAGAEITFVVRPERVGETSPFAVEQVNGPKRRDVLDHPRRVAEIPEEVDLVLVTVRFDQLTGTGEGSVAELLRRGPDRPTVLLTPPLPAQLRSLEQTLGRRVFAAMPGVSGYIDERDVVRYWLMGVASTLIEDPEGPAHATLEALAKRLTNADVPTRLERDVATYNAATTTAFFPLIAAIDAGGGIEGVLTDKALLATTMEAAKESDILAPKLGRVASWAHLLTRFVGQYTIKPGVALARRVSPEAVRFVEVHFGAKLHEQHLAMGASIVALGEEHGVPMPALERLLRQLAGRPSVH
ncbi:ketopantoate reductase family protein [Chondromyces apiculatus]|uniref:2-dehydropantoate 2-reductase n=1 Tax=Chondromyces apiculatus DSM 436 TaxID=1192034 RepID=A0A017TJM8_9BACT|nr:2-dehydropantoate 2-reductase N-terminal domain-containing protein [Chondromyces apiculatus]EYF08856.1 2-dehydropantoate 2-reductase [Chondromyces apiculatus DSM 436]